MTEHSRYIYKICGADEWNNAVAFGTYAGSPDDLRDGFIHFSTRAQVEETAARHFAGRSGLMLVEVDAGALGAMLRWEPSRRGELFPHLYGPLPTAAARAVHPLPLGIDGRHVFPWAAPGCETQA